MYSPDFMNHTKYIWLQDNGLDKNLF